MIDRPDALTIKLDQTSHAIRFSLGRRYTGREGAARNQWKDVLEGVELVSVVASPNFVCIETLNGTKQAALTTQALEITAYQKLMTNIEEMNILALDNDATASVFWPADIEPTDKPGDAS